MEKSSAAHNELASEDPRCVVAQARAINSQYQPLEQQLQTGLQRMARRSLDMHSGIDNQHTFQCGIALNASKDDKVTSGTIAVFVDSEQPKTEIPYKDQSENNESQKGIDVCEGEVEFEDLHLTIEIMADQSMTMNLISHETSIDKSLYNDMQMWLNMRSRRARRHKDLVNGLLAAISQYLKEITLNEVPMSKDKLIDRALNDVVAYTTRLWIDHPDWINIRKYLTNFKFKLDTQLKSRAFNSLTTDSLSAGGYRQMRSPVDHAIRTIMESIIEGPDAFVRYMVAGFGKERGDEIGTSSDRRHVLGASMDDGGNSKIK